eukprot:6190681-Pleurochrysis_carterae.AAC.2
MRRDVRFAFGNFACVCRNFASLLVCAGFILVLAFAISEIDRKPYVWKPKETVPCELPITAVNGRLARCGRPVFLNGVNLAWISYGKDLNRCDAMR